ncbi:phosphotransferase [Paenibacillus filicis]|uniref:Phosphotransferase n=1 Tax=Paenibacillus gyeongsangnamensis TaxID=3388067 RepID=A0ABT4Q2G5_9BACL|nr:phosphotransferase [Paenibacillus filicis]MCZ8511021.1 phosphotransferase [Paenibacillus filicis]
MAHPLHKKTLRKLLRNYGLTLHAYQPLDSLYKKDAAYWVTTDQGPFVLKPYQVKPTGIKLGAIRQISRTASHIGKLGHSGYPHLTKWIKARSNRYWVDWGGKPYYLMDWIEGRQLRFEETDFGLLGAALGRLHTASRDRLSKGRRYSMNMARQFQIQDRLFRARLPRAAQDRRTGRWFKKHGPACLALADEAWSMLNNPEVRSLLSREARHPALTHGDITVPNVLIRDDHVYFIDWDFLRKSSIYFELAKTLANTASFNPALMQALLQGYETIRPLEPSERRLVCAFFRLPREAWFIVRQIALGHRVTGFQTTRDTWDARLAAVRFLDQWAAKEPEPAPDQEPVSEEVMEPQSLPPQYEL